MKYFNTTDKLEALEIDELIRIYLEAEDMNEYENQELIDLVKIDHEYLYGESNIKYLDASQLGSLQIKIQQTIMRKLIADYENRFGIR